jgi:hypothetical protein
MEMIHCGLSIGGAPMNHLHRLATERTSRIIRAQALLPALASPGGECRESPKPCLSRLTCQMPSKRSPIFARANIREPAFRRETWGAVLFTSLTFFSPISGN